MMNEKPICKLASIEEAEKLMEPCTYIHPDAVLEGEAKERAHIFLASEDGRYLAGVWECTPCKERVDSYPGDEFMTVLEGSVTTTDQDGNENTYSEGDSFVMQRGWSGIWNMTTNFKKYFIMYV